MSELKHIVCLSGGKDSSALALRLKELNPGTPYLYVCTPTGDELPDMIQHWERLESILKQDIVRIHHPDYNDIYDLIKEFKMLPNFRARWCTRILKIEAIGHFYDAVKPAVVYVGLRADELTRQGNKLFDDSIKQNYPLQEWGWGINEVLAYLEFKGVTIPRRTDCAMCFYQRLDEWYSLFEEYPEIYNRIERLEDTIGATLMAPGKHKIWPHKLSDLRIEFEKGRMPRAVKTAKNKGLTGYNYGSKCRLCSM